MILGTGMITDLAITEINMEETHTQGVSTEEIHTEEATTEEVLECLEVEAVGRKILMETKI